MPDSIHPSSDNQVAALVELLATSEISLESLTPEERALVEQAVEFDDLKDELQRRIDLYGLDWTALTDQWLHSHPRAEKTLAAYRGALARFNQWCRNHSIDPLRLTPPQADTWLRDLVRTTKLSDASVRFMSKWGCSLYGWLDRRHAVGNPFQGSKAAPRVRKGVVLRVPIASEVVRIIGLLEPLDALVVAVLSETGIPAGALPDMVLTSTGFETSHREKKITGTIPPLVASLTELLAEDQRVKPFVIRTSAQWSMRVRSVLVWRVKTGEIPRAYSLRDFQNYWVVKTWPGSRDLVAFRDRLSLYSTREVRRLLLRLGLVV